MKRKFSSNGKIAAKTGLSPLFSKCMHPDLRSYVLGRYTVLTLAQQLAFLCFLLAMCGFMAQGAMDYYLTEFLGKDLLLPPHIALVWCAAALLIFTGELQRTLHVQRHWNVAIGFGGAVMIFALVKWYADDIKIPFQTSTGMLIFLLTCALVPSEKWRCLFLRTLFLMTIATGLVAIGEFLFSLSTPWSIYTAYENYAAGASTGLEASPVRFPDAILFPLVLAGGRALSRRPVYALPGRALSALTALSGMGGLLVSESRSGFAGAMFGLLLAFLLMNKKQFVALFFAILLVTPIVLFGVAAALEYFGKGDILQDERVYGTWKIYGPVAIIHPFGLQKETFLPDEVVRAYNLLGIGIDDDLLEKIIMIAPHNLILSNAFRYGWLGVFAIIAMYLQMLRLGIKKATDPALEPAVKRCFALICGSILALVVHCLFHNANILMGDMRNWAQLGFMCGLIFVAQAHRISPAR